MIERACFDFDLPIPKKNTISHTLLLQGLTIPEHQDS